MRPGGSGGSRAVGGKGRVRPPLPAPVGIPLRLGVAEEQHARRHALQSTIVPKWRSVPAGLPDYAPAVATLRLFAAAREAARTSTDVVAGATVGEVLASACVRYGPAFEAVLASSRVWVNGSPAEAEDPVGPADEIAVLPPVSGGCG